MNTQYIGFHETSDLPIKRGDKVRIRKGTLITSTRYNKATQSFMSKVAGRDQIVTVDHVLNGITIARRVDGMATRDHQQNPSVRWTGSGGYWYEVDINLVEKV